MRPIIRWRKQRWRRRHDNRAHGVAHGDARFGNELRVVVGIVQRDVNVWVCVVEMGRLESATKGRSGNGEVEVSERNRVWRRRSRA